MASLWLAWKLRQFDIKIIGDLRKKMFSIKAIMYFVEKLQTQQIEGGKEPKQCYLDEV